jgi:tetratricopeptide (TPR) repeat protein
VDPGRWRDRVRDPALWRDRPALARVAAEAGVAKAPPGLLGLLGELLVWSRVDGIGLLVRAQRRHPGDFWLNFNLANALGRRARWEEAIGYYRAALAVRPATPIVYYNLGVALRNKGDLDGAIAEYRKAIALDPKFAPAHQNLGAALYNKGNLVGAIAFYRRAIALDSKLAAAHYNLGLALENKGDRDGAIAECQKAIALDPKDAKAHTILGLALENKGDLDGAIAECQKAIALDPKDAKAHTILGLALADKGDLDGAITALQKAIALDPKDAQVHAGLGEALLEQGRFADGCQATRRALELLPPSDPLRKMASQQLQRGEGLLHLDTKLAAVLKGEAQPAGAAEQLDLAILCRQYKKRYAAAARFYAAAFAADPGLAQDLRNQDRYDAACAAALAAACQGEDARKLPDKEQARLRQLSLGWLQQDLAAWKKVAKKGPAQARAEVRETLQHWQQDPDLASLRGKEALARLPAAERDAWTALWADVAAVVKRARGEE